MAKLAHFEQPVGIIDGINVVFTTSAAYIPGSIVVFLRGIPRVAAWEDGWFETDPTTGTVTLKEPPVLGDDVQFMWCEDIGDVVECAVEPLHGMIEGCSSNVTVQITTIQEIYGIIKECK